MKRVFRHPRRGGNRLVTGGLAVLAVVAVSLSGTVMASADPADPADDSPVAQAIGTTYYVNNASGSGCDDAHDGTSPTEAWCTFASANELELGPGDSLLLARGASWREELTVRASGTAEAPAYVGAYGEGAKPHFGMTDTTTAIRILDPHHLTVADLDVGERDSAGRSMLGYAVLVDVMTAGREGLLMENISVHDSRFVGIFIRTLGSLALEMDEFGLTGVVLRGIETRNNAHGIAFASQGSVVGLTDDISPGAAGANAFRDVLIEGMRAYDNDNNNPAPSQVFQPIDAGCPDALAIGSATNVVVRDSIIDTGAACRTGSGTAGLFLGRIEHVLIANNIFINTPNTMNPDMVAIDHEAATYDVKIAGNYFADNYGGAIEYLAIHGAKDFSTGHETVANTFVRNGYIHKPPYPGAGAIGVLGDSITVDARIADNLAHEPYALLTAKFGGHTGAFTVENNKLIEADSDIFNIGADFGAESSAWGAQLRSSGSWHSLAYETATNSYSDGTSVVDQYGATIGAADAVAFTWTAPRSGEVSIRGYALTEQGEATIAVLRGDAEVLSEVVDGSGLVTAADRVAVAAGDVLRFVVVDADSRVSWMPGVGYTSDTVSTDALGEWTFSVEGELQGWSGDGATADGGALTLPSAGGTAVATSPKLGLSAAVSGAVRLEYANRSGSHGGRVYFTTAEGQDFTTERSVEFAVNPRSDYGLIEGTQSITIPMTSNALWTGAIDRIKIVFDDVAADQRIELPRIQLTAPQVAWEFSQGDGWTFNKDTKCASAGTPSASPTIDIDNSEGGFYPHADLNWGMSRGQIFRVSTPRLAQIDFWTFKVGDLVGCLFARVVKITDDTGRGDVLFTGSIDPSAVTTDGGYVSIYPGLDGLDTSAVYALQLFNPYTLPGMGSYGVGYSDDPARVLANGEYYSVNGNGIWTGPETNRSLNMRTFSAASITPQEAVGWEPVTVSGGSAVGPGGYEPVLRSPAGLKVDAADTRYLHIRMTNPDNRVAAYVLFTTEDDPHYDIPSDGTPPGNEQDKGLVFALTPGGDAHEYVLDMSTIEGWTGTIDQIAVYPSYRWNYRISDNLNSTWTGSIDYVRLDNARTAAEIGSGGSGEGGGNGGGPGTGGGGTDGNGNPVAGAHDPLVIAGMEISPLLVTLAALLLGVGTALGVMGWRRRRRLAEVTPAE